MKLVQLTQKGEISSTYSIYKDCMYNPTPQKFENKIDLFLNDNTIKIFACVKKGEILGIIIVTFYMMHKLEIIGISVAEKERNKGIGNFMLNELVNTYKIKTVYAETDKDAVNFYRKNGFSVTQFYETYNGKTITRYKCQRTL